MLFKTYKWAWSTSFLLTPWIFTPRTPLPSHLPSCLLLGTPTGSQLGKQLEHNWMAYSTMYCSIIEAFGWYWLLICPFKIFMYLSTGYIHLKRTSQHNRVSLPWWTIKWTMISKNEGGKYISNWHNSLMVSFFKSSNTQGSITFLHMTLKNIHKHVKIPLLEVSKMTWKAIGKSCCISTW